MTAMTARPILPTGDPILLTSAEVATFVARGFLAFPAVIPDDVNQRAATELEAIVASWGTDGPCRRPGIRRAAGRRLRATVGDRRGAAVAGGRRSDPVAGRRGARVRPRLRAPSTGA